MVHHLNTHCSINISFEKKFKHTTYLYMYMCLALCPRLTGLAVSCYC